MNRFAPQTLFLALAFIYAIVSVQDARAAQPEVRVEHGVYTFAQQFESTLPADTVAALLFRPGNLSQVDGQMASKLSFDTLDDSTYEMASDYRYLWFYHNRMVVRRRLERQGRTITSTLVRFTQTLGLAPNPRSSTTTYRLLPTATGTSIEFTQTTVFEASLGSLANRVFTSTTLKYLEQIQAFVQSRESTVETLAAATGLHPSVH